MKIGLVVGVKRGRKGETGLTLLLWLQREIYFVRDYTAPQTAKSFFAFPRFESYIHF